MFDTGMLVLNYIAGAWTRTCIENNFRNVGWLGICVFVWEGGTYGCMQTS